MKNFLAAFLPPKGKPTSTRMPVNRTVKPLKKAKAKKTKLV